jgi:4-aminobutyrate aminotransferase-like enzyme
MKEGDPGIGDVRGWGLLLGGEVVSKPEAHAPDSLRSEEMLDRYID